jgi:hypothetical protein
MALFLCEFEMNLFFAIFKLDLLPMLHLELSSRGLGTST